MPYESLGSGVNTRIYRIRKNFQISQLWCIIKLSKNHVCRVRLGMASALGRREGKTAGPSETRGLRLLYPLRKAKRQVPRTVCGEALPDRFGFCSSASKRRKPQDLHVSNVKIWGMGLSPMFTQSPCHSRHGLCEHARTDTTDKLRRPGNRVYPPQHGRAFAFGKTD